MPPPPPPIGGVGILSWKGTSRFNWGRGGGSDGETSFLSGRGAPHGEDIGFDGGFLKKIVGWGRVLQNINKHLYLLYMNDEVKRVFTPKPMVSFRSSRKISS